MQSEKLSISLPASLARFVEHYKVSNACRSRSQVIEEALKLLQEKALEKAYREAEQESDAEWEVTVGDGLDDEAW